MRVRADSEVIGAVHALALEADREIAVGLETERDLQFMLERSQERLSAIVEMLQFGSDRPEVIVAKLRPWGGVA